MGSEGRIWKQSGRNITVKESDRLGDDFAGRMLILN